MLEATNLSIENSSFAGAVDGASSSYDSFLVDEFLEENSLLIVSETSTIEGGQIYSMDIVSSDLLIFKEVFSVKSDSMNIITSHDMRYEV